MRHSATSQWIYAGCIMCSVKLKTFWRIESHPRMLNYQLIAAPVCNVSTDVQTRAVAIH